MKYRRRLKSDTSHFVRSCRWWPKRDFKESNKPSGERCNECRAKAKKRKVPADVQTSRENTLYGGE